MAPTPYLHIKIRKCSESLVWGWPFTKPFPRVIEARPMKLSRATIGALLVCSVAWPASAAQKPKSSEIIWYERIEAGCKADAKKYYSAIHFQKRRAFVK